LTDLRWNTSQYQAQLDRLSPWHAVDNFRQRLDEVGLRLAHAMENRLDRTRLSLVHTQRGLESLNPVAVLKRGYAIVTREKDGHLVKDAGKIEMDESIHIRVSQGSLDARVTRTHPGEP
jgi:exodeoxyribonuclease VII large subunit